ncbi:hypothetical protein JCM3765_004544 [Sporobolomyces pararoseus]
MMALEHPPQASEAPISSASSPSPPTLPPPPTKRQPSFWERTKQSTVGVWDNAYKLGSKREKQSSLEAFYPTSLDVESIRAARILRTFTWDAADVSEESLADRRKSQLVLRKIPPEVVSGAKGLAIVNVFRTGSLFSAINGSGVVLSRLPDGSWSSPSGILLKSAGFPFSAGVDVYDIVLLLRSELAVESFFQAQTSLGEGISVAAGPVGSGMLLDDAAELAAIWSYSKSKNMHEALKLDGTILSERSDENERTYGRRISAEEILNGAVRPEYWCEGLHETIFAAEGSDFKPELIPQGPSASESFPSPPIDQPLRNPLSPPISPPISPDPSIMSNLSRSSNRRLPKEELSEEDLAAKRELEEALKSFGIEDPTVNERCRSEDPLLVIEPQGVDDSFEFENAETPGLTGSRGSRASSASAPASARNSLEVKMNEAYTEKEENKPEGENQTPKVDVDDSKPENSPLTNSPGTPAKPPVPPRRTPRIPAPASPVVAEPEATEGDEKIKEENEEKKEDTQSGETAEQPEGETPATTHEVVQDGEEKKDDASVDEAEQHHD